MGQRGWGLAGRSVDGQGVVLLTLTFLLQRLDGSLSRDDVRRIVFHLFILYLYAFDPVVFYCV